MGLYLNGEPIEEVKVGSLQVSDKEEPVVEDVMASYGTPIGLFPPPSPKPQKRTQQGTAIEKDSQLPKGMLLNIGKTAYRIESHVASGGSGKVYKAYLENSTRLSGAAEYHALKVFDPLKPQFRDDKHIRRFKREFHLLKSSDHRNVVRVFELGKWGNTPVFSMEYLPQNLDQYLRRKRRLDELEQLRLIRELYSGLAYLHGLNPGDPLYHRDLKTKNLLLAEDGTLKVGDLGIAHGNLPTVPKELHDLTAIGKRLRNAGYPAPEQLDSRLGEVGPHSDVFSAAIIGYELVVGKRPKDIPFSPPTNCDERAALLLRTLVPASSIKPSDRPTSSVLLKLLEELR